MLTDPSLMCLFDAVNNCANGIVPPSHPHTLFSSTVLANVVRERALRIQFLPVAGFQRAAWSDVSAHPTRRRMGP